MKQIIFVKKNMFKKPSHQAFFWSLIYEWELLLDSKLLWKLFFLGSHPRTKVICNLQFLYSAKTEQFSVISG